MSLVLASWPCTAGTLEVCLGSLSWHHSSLHDRHTEGPAVVPAKENDEEDAATATCTVVTVAMPRMVFRTSLSHTLTTWNKTSSPSFRGETSHGEAQVTSSDGCEPKRTAFVIGA